MPWPKTARLLVLVARVRFLDWRAHRVVDRGAGLDDGRLLRLMRRWLALHESIGALLPGMPEPEHVQRVRAILARVSPNGRDQPLHATRAVIALRPIGAIELSQIRHISRK